MSDEGGAGLFFGAILGLFFGFLLFSGGTVTVEQWREAEGMCMINKGPQTVKDVVDKNKVKVICVDGTEMERYITVEPHE